MRTICQRRTSKSGQKRRLGYVRGISALHLELGHRLMQLADGLTFWPPVIRQKPREQTRTNVNDLDRETLILLELPGRVLRS